MIANMIPIREVVQVASLFLLVILGLDVRGTEAAECTDYDDYLHRIGGLDTAGDSRDVAVSGTTLYVAAGNPGSVAVVDVSDPTAPALITTIANPGVAVAVAVSDERLFVALGDWGLRVFDISDPGSPILVGAVNSPGIAVDVAVTPNVVLLADRNGGLHIFERASLTTLANLPVLANSVVATVDRAYVVDIFSTLHVINIDDPSNPMDLGSVAENGATRAAVDGAWAYVSGQSWGLHIVDLSDETKPVVVATADVNAYDASIRGRYALVAGPSVTSVDIADPYNPIVVGGATTPGTPEAITLQGDLAFVAGGLTGDAQILDISNPTSPAPLATLDLPSDAIDVDYADGYAYLAALSAGLQIVDVTDPAMPAPILGVPMPNFAEAVHVAGGYAYVGGSDGLKIVDVNPPEDAVIVGGYADPSSITDVTVSGTLALITDYAPSLKIVDVSNPASPGLVGQIVLSGPLRGIASWGNYALVVGDDGLFVVDIENPSSPVLVGGAPSVDASDIVISESLAYIARTNSSPQVGVLEVIDISDPTNPQPVGSAAAMEPFAGKLDIRGNYVYMANGFFAGLHILDVSRPAAPELIGTVSTPGSASNVSASGPVVLIADGASGLSVFPLQCRQRREPIRIEPDDARKTSWLSAGTHVSVAPNPFSETVSINFALNGQTGGLLSVFDVAGRRVRVLDGVLSSGVHVRHWDGRDDSGAQLASGIYFVRLEAGTTVLDSKLVLMR